MERREWDFEGKEKIKMERRECDFEGKETNKNGKKRVGL